MTSLFERKPDTSVLDLPLIAEFSAFNDLLRGWVPAGDGTTGGANTRDGLRLAVRHNYLNFYLAGQSVARVKFGQRPKGLKLIVHDKYVRGELGQGQKEMRFVTGTASDTPAIVADWIVNARKWCKGEKTFVDEVISHNINVIDVEMAMPGLTNKKGKRIAPRMDIVALEPHGAGWQLVFWEAKLIGNGETRAKKGDPRVLEQLKTYRTWLCAHQEEVIGAYRKTCEVLVDLHKRATAAGEAVGKLGAGIIAVVDEKTELVLDPQVRLLVDARSGTRKIEENDHLSKLKAKTTVHLVRTGADLILPVGTATAAAIALVTA